MHVGQKILISIVLLMLITVGIMSVPLANPNTQPMSESPITSLGTQNILWNTTSDFNNYESNNCTIESNNLTLKEVGIAYDFTDDPIGSHPANWSVTEGGNATIQVIAELAGHKNVLECYTPARPDNGWIMYNTFSIQATGAIELWVRVSDALEFTSLILYEGFDPRIWSAFWEGYFKYYKDTIWHDICAISNNAWYHINIEFNKSQGWQVKVNGTQYGDGYAYGFTSTPTLGFDKIYTFASWPEEGFYFYYDAIDYSWTTGYYPGRSYEHYGEKYYSKSIWTSTVQNTADNNPYYENITFSSQMPANTAAYISYRDSQNSINWSDWSAWSSSNIDLTKYGHRYIQIRTLLTTSDALETPTVEWINFCYTIIK